MVEKQLAEEAARQKKAIEEQMAKEAAEKKAEVEKQLAREAERRKQAVEAKLAEQEATQKAAIDDILMKGNTNADDSHTGNVTRSNDSINKLINHYRLEHEKAIEQTEPVVPQAKNIEKIKSLNTKKAAQTQNLKKLKEKVLSSLQKKQTGTAEVSNESKKETADKHKVLEKRYNILNDPRFREHIQKLNLQKDKEVRQQISSLKKVLDMEVTDSSTLDEEIVANNAAIAEKKPAQKPIDKKSEATIAHDIDLWIEQQELLESSPRRMELIEEKKELMKKLQKKYLEDKKIDKIRNQSLLSEIQSALGKDQEE